ncbi:hypothetical protein BCR34DRAFT_667604 [Clohesyomyces aquaticus]|uniref:Uncharacterized protein n=1 Tax=Clohesyomyces aquaticus TaxID=1231657 RepID=A0A1Y1YXY5_9PLEO|nr:hypothetical protein BCR34DRAFT_667604 [Clohesyomyces aquaticus]
MADRKKPNEDEDPGTETLEPVQPHITKSTWLCPLQIYIVHGPIPYIHRAPEFRPRRARLASSTSRPLRSSSPSSSSVCWAMTLCILYISLRCRISSRSSDSNSREALQYPVTMDSHQHDARRANRRDSCSSLGERPKIFDGGKRPQKNCRAGTKQQFIFRGGPSGSYSGKSRRNFTFESRPKRPQRAPAPPDYQFADDITGSRSSDVPVETLGNTDRDHPRCSDKGKHLPPPSPGFRYIPFKNATIFDVIGAGLGLKFCHCGSNIMASAALHCSKMTASPFEPKTSTLKPLGNRNSAATSPFRQKGNRTEHATESEIHARTPWAPPTPTDPSPRLGGGKPRIAPLPETVPRYSRPATGQSNVYSDGVLVDHPTRLAQKLRDLILAPMAVHPAAVYILKAPKVCKDQESCVYIGTAVNVDLLIRRIQDTCGIKGLEKCAGANFDNVNPQLASRIASLCCTELEQFSRPGRCGQGKFFPTQYHECWYAVPEYVAIRTAKRWYKFMQTHPYWGLVGHSCVITIKETWNDAAKELKFPKKPITHQELGRIYDEWIEPDSIRKSLPLWKMYN